MGELTKVSVDFETSHLIFPKMIAIVLLILGIAIVIQNRQQILAAGGYWRDVIGEMDKVRFFGTLILTVIYFSAMVPVGDIWPNTGLGFLICSIPYVLLTGVLFMHDRGMRDLLPVVLTAAIAPTFVWWLFTDLFFLTLP